METKNALRLKGNFNCPYCGVDLRDKSKKPTKDHMIARKFVPKGTLNAEWNLILDACKKCNFEKGRLEDAVSAFSLFSFDKCRPQISKDELARKLGFDEKRGTFRGSNHPETRKPIGNSFKEISINSKFGPLDIRVNFMAPPQYEPYTLNLSKMQIQALYYYISNVDLENISKSRAFTEDSIFLDPKYIHPLFHFSKNGWGDPAAMEFRRRVDSWNFLFYFSTAKSNFKCLILQEQSSTKKPPIFWLLEWNKNYRILGLIRDPNEITNQEQNLPNDRILIQSEPETWISKQVPLKEDDDFFFKFKE